jgi:hypothetical protein
LVLGLLDSLQFGCVCHHAEAFALVLLKLLLVAHLGAKREEERLGSADEDTGARRKFLARNFQLKAEALVKKCWSSREPGAHVCNASYSGGQNQENCSSKPAPTNNLRNPILKKPSYKKKG